MKRPGTGLLRRVGGHRPGRTGAYGSRWERPDASRMLRGCCGRLERRNCAKLSLAAASARSRGRGRGCGPQPAAAWGVIRTSVPARTESGGLGMPRARGSWLRVPTGKRPRSSVASTRYGERSSGTNAFAWPTIRWRSCSAAVTMRAPPPRT